MDNLDKYYSNKPLGCNIENGKYVFRLFAPRAEKVKLILFEPWSNLDGNGKEFLMTVDNDGVWELSIDYPLEGYYYGYRVYGPSSKNEMFNPNVIIHDPYSVAIATKNNYKHEARSIIINTKFDWGKDDFIKIPYQDLIIYELHVRDMTAHPSSGVKNRGTYIGLIEDNKISGLNYLKQLGVNAIELMPCHDFGIIEIPYLKETPEHKFNEWEINTWNPYERNHWGYMTSCFFAPEAYYASNGTDEKDKYIGLDGRQVKEFKELVKAFHREKIAVIMDVVYNHVAHYDNNPFKYIDKKYYFRLTPDGYFEKRSGCGNDFKTERKMARRLIIDSIKYWMEEYHIDGFRFDLATMIDLETLEQITIEAKKINPNVILIAEPWGGGYYNLAQFSDLGWAAWNDLFRNGVKGSDPYNGKGYIFGNTYGVSDINNLKNYILGSLRKYGGPFISSAHSINYLESHDNYTLGDFIRVALGDITFNTVIKDINAHAKLTDKQLKYNKLAALFLFTSQGAIMIHQGQEFGRSKVIANTKAPDPNVGKIDGNSYEKDNETNWINYYHKDLNIELVNYYKGLINIRKRHKAFRHSSPKAFKFLNSNNHLGLGYFLSGKETNDNDFVVLMNSDSYREAVFNIPYSKWEVLVDSNIASIKPIKVIEDEYIILPPVSGMLLKRVNY